MFPSYVRLTSEDPHLRRDVLLQLARWGVVALAMPGLAGCARRAAPSLSLGGSYFPSWLVCAIGGAALAVAARVLLVRVGIDELLPAKLMVYTCLAMAFAFGLSLYLFSR